MVGVQRLLVIYRLEPLIQRSRPPRRVSDALREFIPVNFQGGLFMSIELLLTVASFAVSVFALGYMLGFSHKNQK